jgi:hypothetical protein
MSALGWIGVWLLAASALAIVIEGGMMVWWALALGRRTRTLGKRLELEGRKVTADLQKLTLAIEEMKRLWEPYRRVLRFLGHPLTIAIIESYRRRRRAAAG